jgi:hypothetical protein
MLAASVGTADPIANDVRAIGLIVAAIIGALVVFVAAVFAIGLLQQRRPPYPMG